MPVAGQIAAKAAAEAFHLNTRSKSLIEQNEAVTNRVAILLPSHDTDVQASQSGKGTASCPLILVIVRRHKGWIDLDVDESSFERVVNTLHHAVVTRLSGGSDFDDAIYNAFREAGNIALQYQEMFSVAVVSLVADIAHVATLGYGVSWLIENERARRVTRPTTIAEISDLKGSILYACLGAPFTADNIQQSRVVVNSRSRLLVAFEYQMKDLSSNQQFALESSTLTDALIEFSRTIGHEGAMALIE